MKKYEVVYSKEAVHDLDDVWEHRLHWHLRSLI